MKNVKARFQVVVKRIMKKVEKANGGMDEEEYRESARLLIVKKRREESDKVIDRAIRDEIVANYVVELDSKKATESVSWAKFGEKSKSQYEWQLVMETICKQKSEELGRKIEVKDLTQMLRDETTVSYNN